MSSINLVVFDGNLVSNPTMKKIGENDKAEMRVAINRVFKNRDGEKTEKTVFIDVEAWGKLASLCGENLKKGARVVVEGRLDYDTWENEGEKRHKIFVTASNVVFASRTE